MTVETEQTPQALARHLLQLVHGGAMAGADADTARDLAHRLTAPARVVVLTRGREAASLAEVTVAALHLPGLEPAGTTLPDDPAALAAVLARLSTEADILLWCSDHFGATEAAAWAQVPDWLKDHSLLVALPGTSTTALAAMREAAQHDFARFVAPSGGSDCSALRDAVQALAGAGRGALVDAADVLLLRAALPAARHGAQPAPAEPPLRNQHCADLAHYLSQRGAELLPLATNPRAVLDNCLAACEAVAESLSGTPEADRALAEDVTDAADRMLLIAMEDGPAAAADAVAVLLQLRRDFACRAAA